MKKKLTRRTPKRAIIHQLKCPPKNLTKMPLFDPKLRQKEYLYDVDNSACSMNFTGASKII